MNFKQDQFNSPDEVLEYEREQAALDPDYEEDQEQGINETDSEIIELFDEHKATMEGHWNDIYNDMEDDWDVYNLDQWSESGKRARGKRPKITVDISRKFVKSVVAETFKNPPGVKLTARTDDSSDKAKYISEAIRYFESRTGAIYAYSQAKESAAVCGLGWLKVTYRYDEQQAMPAVIDIDRISDPLSIMIDPDSKELDGSDALYGMEIHGKEDGREKYTYWWKDDNNEVKWAIINGKSIEDKGTFPGNDIPLVPVYGEIYRIRNKTKCFGLIRQLKDTQRAYNYTMSEAIERLALTPKSPIVAVNGAIPNQFIGDWQRSMTEPVPILFWSNKDEQGQPTLPEPTRNNSNPDVNWVAPMVGQLQMTANEITGIFPDSYGSQNTAESGVAIKARTDNADRGQLVYDEHLQISIKQVGSIMLDLLEPVVTPAGILPIMSEDGTTGTKSIGETTPILDEMGMMQPALDENGQPMYDEIGQPVPMLDEPELPDLDVTDLEISVDAAPAYATRKAEGIDKITEILPMLPPEQQSRLVPQVLRDLDFPGAEEYANTLQPNPEDGPDPVALQQQLADMQMQMEQMGQANQELENQNMQLAMQLKQNTTALMGKAEMDNQTKVVVENMKQEGNLLQTQMEIDAQAVSDNKNVMSKQQSDETKANTEFVKLAHDAEKTNASIAQDTIKQQQESLNSLEISKDVTL